MKGDCSANRPNSGVAVGVQFEGNNKEEVVEGFCVGAVETAVGYASSTALEMACELCEDCFQMTRAGMLQSKSLQF